MVNHGQKHTREKRKQKQTKQENKKKTKKIQIRKYSAYLKKSYLNNDIDIILQQIMQLMCI